MRNVKYVLFHSVNMANMFYLSLCVTLFFVFLNNALCLESKLCNISFMDDDIICDCSARGLKSIPRDCPGNTTQLIMTGNNLYLLDNDAFINFPKLQYLNMETVRFQKQDKRRLPN
jgi:hypothetical protein